MFASRRKAPGINARFLRSSVWDIRGFGFIKLAGDTFLAFHLK